MTKRKIYSIIIHFIIIQNVYGYLDPGTWGYALQLLLMVFVGGLVAVKTFWQNIKIFFINLFKRKK